MEDHDIEKMTEKPGNFMSKFNHSTTLGKRKGNKWKTQIFLQIQENLRVRKDITDVQQESGFSHPPPPCARLKQ